MPGKRASEDQRRGEILEAAYRVAVKHRLAGLTTRAVAAEAGVSNGLVFFHFRNREELLLALLDWVLARTIPPDSAATTLGEALRGALERLPQHRERIELFFDYWFYASRTAAVQRKIRTSLNRYRKSWERLAADEIRIHPRRYADVTSASLASVVTALIEGCSLQVVLSPAGTNLRAVSAAMEALVSSGGAKRP